MASAETLPRHDTRPVLFIADLHLDPRRPAMIDRFRAFCAGPAREAEAVYILGDLFEVWIGDDDADPAYAPVIASLSDLAEAGTRACFMAGNRDFLVGSHFLERTGLRALPEPQTIELFGTRTVLCHGDTLCTDDTDYQRFRAQVRTQQWQRDFLRKPLAERRRIADGLRGDSRSAMADKESAIMDVNETAVRALFRHEDARRMIHGHTHRPARHEHRLDGTIVERHVLGDWHHCGSMLVATREGMHSVELD